MLSRMNLVLIGYRGSGKTQVGRALSARLSWPFIDTDCLIEQRAGKTIRQIFAEHEEPAFRDLESQVITEVAQLDGQIISAGGGAVLRQSNVQALRLNAKFVWLTAPAEILWARISADVATSDNRPNLTASGGLEEIRKLLAQREPIYQQVADLTLDTA